MIQIWRLFSVIFVLVIGYIIFKRMKYKFYFLIGEMLILNCEKSVQMERFYCGYFKYNLLQVDIVNLLNLFLILIFYDKKGNDFG